MNFTEFYLNEMIIVGSKPIDQDYIIAFDKWIWILNDKKPDDQTEFQNISNRLKVFKDIGTKIGMDNEKIKRLTRNEDIYDFITGIQEEFGDILVGQVQGKNLYLYDYGSFKQDPKSSVLVKKVIQQLKLSSASYVEDLDSTETKISKKKMDAKIPDIAYHGTSSKYLDKIARFGLRAGEAESNYAKQGIEHPDLVFFATRIGEAMHHATHTANQVGGVSIILEFTIPDKDQIIADYDVEKLTDNPTHYVGVGRDKPPYAYSPKSFQQDPDKLSRMFGVYGYKGNIKPIFIKNVYVSSKPADETYSIKDFKKMKPKTLLRQIDMGYFDF